MPLVIAPAQEVTRTWYERLLADPLFGTTHTLREFLMMLAVLLASFLLSRLVQRGMRRSFERRQLRDEGTLTVAQRLVHYAIMGAGLFIALKTGDIHVTELFAAGAVVAVVVGFAMQNMTENFVAGVILMAERSITPGDILEVDGRIVRVVKMGIRATVARTRDEEEMIIPNSLLVRATVKNYTLDDSLYRLRAKVGVSFESDLRLVRRVLEETAAKITWRDPSREPRILLLEFGPSAVHFEASVWIEDPWHSQRALSQLNEAIWWAFKEARIRYAFPQLELHVDVRDVPSLARDPDGARSADTLLMRDPD